MTSLLNLLAEIGVPLGRLARDYPRIPKPLRLTVVLISAAAAMLVGLLAFCF